MTSHDQGITCPHCGNFLATPQSSEHVCISPEDSAVETVRNLWRCSKCSNEFVTWNKLDGQQALSPDIIEQFMPSLLVA